MITDNNNAGATVLPGNTPGGVANGSNVSYSIGMQTGDTLIMCVPSFAKTLLLRNTVAGDVSLETSTSVCKIQDGATNTICGLVPNMIFNPLAKWDSCGATTDVSNTINISSKYAIKITCVADTTVDFDFVPTVSSGSCYTSTLSNTCGCSGGGSSSSSIEACCPATNVLLTNIVTTLNDIVNAISGSETTVNVNLDTIENLLTTISDNNDACCATTQANLTSLLTVLQAIDVSSQDIVNAINTVITNTQTQIDSLTVVNNNLLDINSSIDLLTTSVDDCCVTTNNNLQQQITLLGDMNANSETTRDTLIEIRDQADQCCQTTNNNLTDQTTLLSNINTNIASLLAEAIKQKDFEPILLQDCDDTLYIMRKVYNQTDGTYTIDFVDISGATYTPTCANPVGANDIELVENCFTVVNAFGGYAVGDILTRVVVYDTNTSTILSTFFIDALGVSVSPLLTDIEPCSDASLLQQIVDNQEDQETLLTAINNNTILGNTTLSNMDSTLTNIQIGVQSTIVAINNLDASLSTEIQDATTAITTQDIASTAAIVAAIGTDLDYVPTDTVVYWEALNAGTGYAIGDTIKEETTKKYEDNVLVSTTTVYTNMSTNTVITPLVDDLGAVGGNTVATNQDNIVKLYDILPSGENVPFYAVANSDGAGNFLSYTPISYTPAGNIEIDPRWTNMGYQTINIDDTAVYTLTVPAGCNHADVNFIGTTAPLDPIVDYAWYQINNGGAAPTTTSGFKSLLAGQKMDLQGADELNAFQIICGVGMSGVINVSYKFNPNMQI